MMNSISNKLRAKTGASMIMAMVFLLFALFVGGVVLASAAANGYRSAEVSEVQAALNQRSAAMLVAEELSGAELTLTITEVTTVCQPVSVKNGTVTDDPGQTPITARTVTIQTPQGQVMTALQRLAVEAAIGRYLLQSGMDIDDVTANFSGTGEFWLRDEDTVKTGGTVTMTEENGRLEGFTLDFQCCDGTELYDFVVELDSGMTVKMDGYWGTNQSLTTLRCAGVAQSISATGYARVTVTTNVTTIAWSGPVIEKGGGGV